MQKRLEMLECDVCETNVNLTAEEAVNNVTPGGWISGSMAMLKPRVHLRRFDICGECAPKLPMALMKKLMSSPVEPDARRRVLGLND